MNKCMIIRGAVPVDGKEMKFRPSSTYPTNHWTTQLLDPFTKREHFRIEYLDEEFVITLTKESKEEDENLFEHVMDFAKIHGIDHTECRTECNNCKGHEKCLTNHK